MRFLTDFADQAVILPLAVAVGLALLFAGWRRGALTWALAVAGTLGAVLVAKVLVLACIGAVAFPDLRSPSGHTASAAVVYGGLVALLLPAPVHGARRLIAALLLGAGFAVVFGSTRLALHVHTRSDVLAGACLGIAGALALARFAGPRPPGLRVAVPVSAALAVALLLHGTHLHAEEVIDRLSCRVWSGPLALFAAAPPLHPASALP
jgi:membrane-associated phospholipid phosphatase